MKKKLIIVLSVALILILAIAAWFYGYNNRKSNDNLPALATIAEMDEADVNTLLMGYNRIQLIEVWGEPDSIQLNEDIWIINDKVSLRVNSNNKGVVVICGLIVENMYIKPTEFTEETLEVLSLFDDEIQFFDIVLNENIKSEIITVWVYRDGVWEESGKTYGPVDDREKRIAVRLTENSYELYSIDESGYVKYTSPNLDTNFEESMAVGGTRIDREIPLELNKEIPIWVKIGTETGSMDIFDVTEDFRKLDCNAGIVVTLTVSDEVVE